MCKDSKFTPVNQPSINFNSYLCFLLIHKYMLRNFLLFITFISFCLAGTAQNKFSANELNALDKEIKHKYIYDSQKKKRIEALKGKADSSAKFSAGRCDALIEMAREYETFISDSALAYFNQAHDIARVLNDSSRITLSRLGRVKVLAILGYFKESITELDEVEAHGIPESLKPEWLDTGRQLYAYTTSYVNENKTLLNKYLKLVNYYRDLQIATIEEDSPEHKLFLAEHYLVNGQMSKAKLLFGELIEEVPNSSNIYARAAHNMSSIKKSEGQEDVAAYYLALSAISDIKCSVKETLSLQELAIYLYNNGDISHAYSYISSSLADAVFCNARLRTAELSKIIPLIDGAYKEQLDEQRKTLVFTNLLVGVLLIGLVIILVVMLRQMDKVKTARQQLNKANSIKEEYIGHFLDICAIYMDRLSTFSKVVTRKITAGQVEELLKMAKSSKFTEGQHEQFYDIFDATFLHIYPTFIDDFNTLLLPEEQITIKEPGHLTSELRIFALLRMGVEDSNKIAKFLNYSVNTIYAYRNKIKNKAKNRENFEAEVMKIGSFT